MKYLLQNLKSILIIFFTIFSIPLLRNEQLIAQNLGTQSTANHTTGFHADGTVYSWGLNDAGQLGDGTTIMLKLERYF
jgi:alpha-tubulin suppressor-like RCC1 family protein